MATLLDGTDLKKKNKKTLTGKIATSEELQMEERTYIFTLTVYTTILFRFNYLVLCNWHA